MLIDYLKLKEVQSKVKLSKFYMPKLLKFFILHILDFVMYKMAILTKIKSHFDVINYFKELPFYNKPIERPIKRLKNIDPLVELLFYEQLSVIKTD